MHFAQPKFLGTGKIQIRRRRAREDVQTNIYQCDDKISWTHSLYETVKFTATYLKCVSALDFSLRAAWAGHWLLGRPKQL